MLFYFVQKHTNKVGTFKKIFNFTQFITYVMHICYVNYALNIELWIHFCHIITN